MSASSSIERIRTERETRAPLCRPGDTCWVRLPARRIAWLVDAEAYYAALYDTLLAARQRVWIVGWDVHARTPLRPEAKERGELGTVLDSIARRRRGLRIYVLEWDYSMLLAGERGLAPWIDLDWRTHPRVKFLLDDQHPLGACVHEKIVVVDDAVAFVGGLDLTARRWDTPAHRADDPRRVDPAGKPYEPFHDVQMMVEGDVARAIGERVRRRWNEVSGARVRRVQPPRNTPWPRTVSADVRDADVAVACTEPAPPGEPELGVRQIERLYLASIRSARASIYVENQYFSAESIADALCERLGEPHGPEVVLVLPSACSGWIEERTMGARRAHLLERLREADRFDRFRAYAPHVPGAGRVNVHAKLMIVDDALVRIGSANLAKRSLQLDRECDLALEACGRRDVAKAIAGLRARLLGEHLGVAPERFDAAYRERGRSVIGAIEALRQGPRTLEPLDASCAPGSGWLALPVDPAESSEWLELLARFTPEELRDPHRRGLLLGFGSAAAFAALVGLGWLAGSDGAHLLGSIQRGALVLPGPALALAVAVGVQLFLPVTALLLLAIALLGPGAGGLWGLLGALAGAAGGWCVGRYWIGSRIERLAPARITAFRRRLGQRSILEVAAARLTPALPFAIGNLAAGAARLGLREFVVGTALSLLPYWAMLGAVFVTVHAAWRDRSLATAASAVLATLASLLALVALRRWSRGRCSGGWRRGRDSNPR